MKNLKKLKKYKSDIYTEYLVEKVKGYVKFGFINFLTINKYNFFLNKR